MDDDKWTLKSDDMPIELMEKIAIAFKLLEQADIIEEHPDHLWLQVDKVEYERFFEPFRYLVTH